MNSAFDKARIPVYIISICFAFFFVTGCAASRINLNKQVLGVSTELPCKAAIYIDNFRAQQIFSGIKSSRDYYRDFIEEIFGELFSEVVIVNNLSDIESTKSSIVISISLIQTVNPNTISLVHNVKVEVYDIEASVILSLSNSASKLNMTGGVDDHRNLTIKSMTPIVSELSKDRKIMSCIEFQDKMKYASKYTRQSPSIAQDSGSDSGEPAQPQTKSIVSKKRALKSSGSGFFINKDGYALTNHHVVDGCEELSTKIHGKEYPLTLIGSDKNNDLAILKIDNTINSYAKFRGGKGMKVGDDVTVIGYPLGEFLSTDASATFGSVNSLRGLHDNAVIIRISAAIQPGNSGGPVFDNMGNVAGVTVSSVSSSFLLRELGTVPQNINFAINGFFVMTFLDAYNISYSLSTQENELKRSEIAEKGISFTIPVFCY